MNVDEKELITRAKAGDRKAFDKLVRLNKNKMFSLTYRMTGNREAALDLLQDTFFSAFKEISRFREDSGFSSWLYRIASNKALNYLRRKKILTFFSLSETTLRYPSYEMDDNISRTELQNEITTAVDSLPPKQKIVFNLRFYEELSFAEIAGILKRSESAVKTNYQKAVEKLRKRLKAFR